MIATCHFLRWYCFYVAKSNLLLERGDIVESGRHAELVNQKGLYYAMWRQQVGERALPPHEGVVMERGRQASYATT